MSDPVEDMMDFCDELRSEAERALRARRLSASESAPISEERWRKLGDEGTKEY